MFFFCHPLYVIDSTKNMQQKEDNVICTETRHVKAVIIMQSAHVFLLDDLKCGRTFLIND